MTDEPNLTTPDALRGMVLSGPEPCANWKAHVTAAADTIDRLTQRVTELEADLAVQKSHWQALATDVECATNYDPKRGGQTVGGPPMFYGVRPSVLNDLRSRCRGALGEDEYGRDMWIETQERIHRLEAENGLLKRDFTVASGIVSSATDALQGKHDRLIPHDLAYPLVSAAVRAMSRTRELEAFERKVRELAGNAAYNSAYDLRADLRAILPPEVKR